MDDLIKALQIFRKYLKEDNHNPTHCEHDVMYIMDVIPEDVSAEDIVELDRLGFFIDKSVDTFASFRFGSA